MGLKCPYCGGTVFYEGPSGGMSVNIMCVTPQCEHWFNHGFDLDDLHQKGLDRRPSTETPAHRQAVMAVQAKSANSVARRALLAKFTRSVLWVAQQLQQRDGAAKP